MPWACTLTEKRETATTTVGPLSKGIDPDGVNNIVYKAANNYVSLIEGYDETKGDYNPSKFVGYNAVKTVSEDDDEYELDPKHDFLAHYMSNQVIWILIIQKRLT
jgi:hypothetical protein